MHAPRAHRQVMPKGHTPHMKNSNPPSTRWDSLVPTPPLLTTHMSKLHAHRGRTLVCLRHSKGEHTYFYHGSVLASLWGVWRVVNTSFPHTQQPKRTAELKLTAGVVVFRASESGDRDGW